MFAVDKSVTRQFQEPEDRTTKQPAMKKEYLNWISRHQVFVLVLVIIVLYALASMIQGRTISSGLQVGPPIVHEQ